MKTSRRQFLSSAVALAGGAAVTPLVVAEAAQVAAPIAPMASSWTMTTSAIKAVEGGFQYRTETVEHSTGKVTHPDEPMSPVFSSEEEALAWAGKTHRDSFTVIPIAPPV